MWYISHNTINIYVYILHVTILIKEKERGYSFERGLDEGKVVKKVI